MLRVHVHRRMMTVAPLIVLGTLLPVACAGDEEAADPGDAAADPAAEAVGEEAVGEELVQALGDALYFEQLRVLLAEYTALHNTFEQNTFGRVSATTDPTQAAGFLAAFYSASAELAQEVREALESLEPPPNAEDAHLRLLATVADRQEISSQIARTIGRNDDSEQGRQAARDLVAQEEVIRKSEQAVCARLQGIAAATGFPVTLACA